MATLQDLKRALRSDSNLERSSLWRTLSNAQYSVGFSITSTGSTTYESFIIPQLSQLLAPLFKLRGQISALEIGPGPQSVLGRLPHHQRSRIRRFTAFEPNELFATRLETWLLKGAAKQSPLFGLEDPPNIQRIPFAWQEDENHDYSDHMHHGAERYDLVLFCHSLYGMRSKREAIEHALNLLTEKSDGMVVVVHRDGALHLDGLVCHKTISFPTGIVKVADDDEVLDDFAPFIAGFTMQDEDLYETIQTKWRKVCRALGRHENACADHLIFSSPEIMTVLTQNATALPELLAQVPVFTGERTMKNRQACLRRPASVVQPTTIEHIQACVHWALQYNLSLAIIAGGHGGHCMVDNVVSIDMSSFNSMHIFTTEEGTEASHLDCDTFVVIETGCTTGDVISKTMAAGLTVPLGSRPSVGAGSWLQGGLGHLSRLHGLACDAIVGAVLVSVRSGQVVCVGYVPSQHRPAASTRPKNEADILWSVKGAGTICGIVVSMTFKAYKAPLYEVRNWVVPLGEDVDAQLKLGQFDGLIARKMERNASADAYLYWDDGQMRLGMTVVKSITTAQVYADPIFTNVTPVTGTDGDFAVVNGVELFETEMYVSRMHNGHGGGKTSSFKRCLFVEDIGNRYVAMRLLAAMESRPSPLCYLHLLQGGGAVDDIAIEASAFGPRDWHFACVITGVWPRDQDGSKVAQAVVEWVYSVAVDLLPLSSGVYGADLGPDPRDAVLADHAFGPNRRRLAQLKDALDPQNVLAHACPLQKVSPGPKLIILVTGESCAGKDYCAYIWSSMMATRDLVSRTVSISDAIKRRYAEVTGANSSRLLSDRAYKEQHRPALTAYFLEQVQHNPQLPQEQFLNVVHNAADVDVLLITGMRDKAPVATLSHLLPECRLLEVYVQASGRMRQIRKGCRPDGSDDGCTGLEQNGSTPRALDHRPNLTFDNEADGSQCAEEFFQESLVPFVHEDLWRLEAMVHQTSNFPRQNIVFRHVLGICQQPRGLALCTSLLERHFTGDWNNITNIVCCEVGGIVFGSALALQVNVPMVLIREAGKLPPPTFHAVKSQSHISSLVDRNADEKRIEMEQDAIPRDASVLVVDDVLATGETLCAVLQLLYEAGIGSVDILVVAEFPIHRGRENLRRRGHGKVNVRSLLTFGGA